MEETLKEIGMADALSAEHRHMLEGASGIATEVIAARGYRTVTKRTELRRLGFVESQAIVPALLIPVWTVRGEVGLYQARPDSPRVRKGKLVKYETPAGSLMVLDVHPFSRKLLADPAIPLWITEGVKKGDALLTKGCCSTALLGVWNWRGTNEHGGKTVLSDWELVALNNRSVYICFDSDVMRKPEVNAALGRLVAFLRSRGSQVGLIYLPAGPGGIKQGVDDFLASGKTVDDLLALATPQVRDISATSGSQINDKATAGERNLPVIVVTGKHRRDISQESIAALAKANDGAPTVFNRGGVLVRLKHDEYGWAAQALTPPMLSGKLDRAADYVAERDDRLTPSRPPFDVVLDITTLGEWPFPELKGLAMCPILVNGGRIVTTSGYDRESGLYVDLKGLELGPRMQRKTAVTWLTNELLGDFPFADDASLAHALALIIQPFVRHVIEGPTPLYLVDAPAPGSGKGLLTEVAAITLGQPAAVNAQPKGDDETRKLITALLLAGRPMVVFDNVHRLDSTALSALLTSTVWEDRILGISQVVRLRNLATWQATGNNVALSPEMARRTILIRLDSGIERPEDRGNFRHPELTDFVRRHRAELVTAVISIVQDWVDAEMPAGNGSLGRYEEWVRVIGGILKVAGVDGFLGNRQYLRGASDVESAEWIRVCRAWWERFGPSPITAGDLFSLLKEKGLLLDILAGRTPLSVQQRLGHALQGRRDRVFQSWRIRSAGNSSETGSAAYRLEVVAAHDRRKTPETKETKSGESAKPAGVSGVSGVSADVLGNNSDQWEVEL